MRALSLIALVFVVLPVSADPAAPPLRWADSSRNGVTFSKDPCVVRFGGRYLMYYSMPPTTDKNVPPGWAIGIAESRDLLNWKRIGQVLPEQECEKKGNAAPGAIVLDGKVHLFYQTYGNGRNDAICHAFSDDGLTFKRNPTNPVFHPTGDWNCGRAIDAEVAVVGDRLMLWSATRDPEMKIQMLVAAAAPLKSDFSRGTWKQLSDAPLLKPELPWETKCIEAPSVIRRGQTLWMFYAGGYNNNPQQIGVATSADGIAWKRWSDQPFLPNGAPGEWNASESGHPGIFEDHDGRTYLFFQGNNDKGKTWYISAVEVEWTDKGPSIKRDSAKFPLPSAK